MDITESELRLRKLHQYLPFLQETKISLSSPEENLKIENLINMISNAEEQLLAGTLEKCEDFFKSLDSKFGMEVEIKMKSNLSAGEVGLNANAVASTDNRSNNSQHLFENCQFNILQEATAAQETKQLTLHSVPIETVIRPCSPIADHPSQPSQVEQSDETLNMLLHPGDDNVKSFSIPKRRQSQIDSQYKVEQSSMGLETRPPGEKLFHTNNQQPSMLRQQDALPNRDPGENDSGEPEHSIKNDVPIKSTDAGPIALRINRLDLQGPHLPLSAPFENGTATEKNRLKNVPTSGHRLLSHPSKNLVAISSKSLPKTPSTQRVLNGPATSSTHQQQNQSQISPSPGAARLRDSLLANFDSRLSRLSRHYIAALPQRPIVADQAAKVSKKETRKRKHPAKPTTALKTDCANRKKSRKSVSPNDLYSGALKSAQTSRPILDVRSFKIPKKITSSVNSSECDQWDVPIEMWSENSTNESTQTMIPSVPQESSEAKPSNKKKGKSSLPREIVHLHENLTDFVKGVGELGSRRSRSRAIQSSATNCKLEDRQRALLELTAKRNKKRKITDPEKDDMATFSPEPPLKKNVPFYISNKRPSPDIPSVTFKTAAMKKGSVFQNLPGIKNEKAKETDSAASDDFKCEVCSKRVKGVIDHYVNEHPDVEMSFVTIPENEWEKNSSQDSAIVPAHQEMIVDEYSWIPDEPDFTKPVRCKLCTYKTCTQSELIEHVLVHALPTNCKYRCVLCGLIKTRFFDMLDHIAGHTGEFRYGCNVCSHKFAYLSDIKNHLSYMHEVEDGLDYYITSSPVAFRQLWINGFVCKRCRYVQMTEEQLVHHLELHQKCCEYTKVSLISLVHTEPDEKKEIVKPNVPGNKIRSDLSTEAKLAEDIQQKLLIRRFCEDVVSKNETETEFFGFILNEQAEAKKHLLDFIAMVPDPEERSAIIHLFETNPALELAKQESEEHQVLDESKLNVCGNIGCEDTTETPAKLGSCIGM